MLQSRIRQPRLPLTAPQFIYLAHIATIMYAASCPMIGLSTKCASQDLYATILDDEPAVLANGLARPDKFNQMLFGGSGLKDGQHRIVLQNRYSSTPAYTDVDYIVFTAGDGNSQ